MSKFKIIALVVLAATNTAALAYNIPPCSTPITIPCLQSQWHVGAKALYLRPDFGGNNLGYSSFNNYGTDFFNNVTEVNGAPNHLNNIVPDRTWSFQLEAGYAFCAGNDIDLNWYHLDEDTNGHLPRGTLFAGSASALYAGRLNINSRWDEVNLEFGQRFHLNEIHVLRLHAGLTFSRIEATFTNFPQLTPTGVPIFATKDTITYRGFGPRIGGDYTHNFCFGLGVYAKAAGSLLVGSAKQSVSGYRDLGGFNLYSTGNYHQSNNNVIVPELEADLGLKYDYRFRQGKLGVNAGYMFVTYLGALVSQVGAGVVSSSISTSSSTNFNLNGPYLGVTWSGFIC